MTVVVIPAWLLTSAFRSPLLASLKWTVPAFHWLRDTRPELLLVKLLALNQVSTVAVSEVVPSDGMLT